MTLPRQFVPQPRGTDVCPCERCPPGACEGIAIVERARAAGRRAAEHAKTIEDLFA